MIELRQLIYKEEGHDPQETMAAANKVSRHSSSKKIKLQPKFCANKYMVMHLMDIKKVISQK